MPIRRRCSAATVSPDNVSTTLYKYPTLTSRLGGAYLELDVSDLDIHVAGHGDEVSMEGPNGEDVSPSQRAGSLRANPLYSEGTPVRLLSCSVGACDTGFAAQLSQELGATVKAPIGLLEIYESGRLVVRGGTSATFG